MALRYLGLQQGEAVAVFVNNVAERSLVLYATLLLNVPFVNCNPRAAPNADEVRHFLMTSGARALIATDVALAMRLDEAAAREMKSMRLKVLLGNDTRQSHPETASYLYFGNQLVKAANRPDVPRSLDELENLLREQDDTMIILITSGTTSPLKGCAVRLGQHESQAICLRLAAYRQDIHVLLEKLRSLAQYKT